MTENFTFLKLIYLSHNAWNIQNKKHPSLFCKYFLRNVFIQFQNFKNKILMAFKLQRISEISIRNVDEGR